MWNYQEYQTASSLLETYTFILELLEYFCSSDILIKTQKMSNIFDRLSYKILKWRRQQNFNNGRLTTVIRRNI